MKEGEMQGRHSWQRQAGAAGLTLPVANDKLKTMKKERNVRKRP